MWLFLAALRVGDAAGADPLYRLAVERPLSATEIAYACTYLHSEAPQPAVLSIGAAGPVKAWLGGVQVLRDPRTLRKLSPNSARAFLRLPEGRSFLLVKVCGPGEPAFHFRFTAADGKPLADVTWLNPLDPTASAAKLTWASIGPFCCYSADVALDTRYPVERNLAGPPRDAWPSLRWRLCVKARPDPGPELVNGSFEYLDPSGRLYGWYGWPKPPSVAPDAAEGKFALHWAGSQEPVSGEARSYPFIANVRRRIRVSFALKVALAGEAHAGQPLACWVQWLDAQRRVIAAAPVGPAEADLAGAGDWVVCRSDALRPPFDAALGRLQFKRWNTQSEVWVDHVQVEALGPSE